MKDPSSKIIKLIVNSPNFYDRAEQSKDSIAVAYLTSASIEALMNDLWNYLEFASDHIEDNERALKSTDGLTILERAMGRPPNLTIITPFKKLNEEERALLALMRSKNFERKPIIFKIKKILEICCNGKIDTKMPNLYNLDLLITARNELAHPKRETLTQKMVGNAPSSVESNYGEPLLKLIKAGIVSSNNTRTSWINSLDSFFAERALNITVEFIEDFLAVLPKTVLMDMFREQAAPRSKQ